MLILLFHWILRSTGDALTNTMEYVPSNMNTMSNDNRQNWFVGIGIANIFWIIGEICGDWYPLMRTKAIINNKEKIKRVYITCFIYNMIKIFSIFHFFYQFYNVNQNDNENQSMTKFGLYWWIVVAVTQISSLCYDLSVIICLKQNLFNQLHSYSLGKNSFIERFKRISEFRIVFSMAANIIFFPIILLYIVFVLKYSLNNKSSVPFDDDSMEVVRKVVINVNYTLMYIDQILLKCYVKRNNNTTKNNKSLISSTHSSNNLITYSELKYEDKNKYFETPVINKAINTIRKPDNIINIENYYQPKLNITNNFSNSFKNDNIDNYYNKPIVNYKMNISGSPHFNEYNYNKFNIEMEEHRIDYENLMSNIKPFDNYYRK